MSRSPLDCLLGTVARLLADRVDVQVLPDPGWSSDLMSKRIRLLGRTYTFQTNIERRAGL